MHHHPTENIQSFVQQAFEALKLTDSTPSSLELSNVSGGDINQAYECLAGGQRFFVKLNKAAHGRLFLSEATALAKLANAELPVPQVIGCYENTTYACLVLPFVVLQPLDAEGFYRAGQRLANCHLFGANQFGWPEDNFIGTSAQINTRSSDWGRFFIEFRLKPQLVRLNHTPLSDYQKKLTQLESFFLGYSPQPSLLHGDLWSGNLAADEKGQPLFYDPASYFGDRETDLAMTELFGGFPTSFYQGYQSIWPLDAGYKNRKTVYQLYHLLNHANLFGGHYIQQCHDVLSRLLNRR